MRSSSAEIPVRKAEFCLFDIIGTYTRRKGNMENYKILDATCGSRMIWFNKKNPDCLYMAQRFGNQQKMTVKGT